MQPVYQAADFCALSFAVAGWARAVTARHNEMPPVPPANRSNRGTGDHTEVRKDARFPQVPATMASSHTLKRQGSFVPNAWKRGVQRGALEANRVTVGKDGIPPQM
jgi:hypothetical protein